MKTHPQLSQKLLLLYGLQLNPSIKNHAELAKRLGITRQALNQWIRGTDTRSGDSIPHSKVQSVCEIFSIEPHWLTLSMEEFREKLLTKMDKECTGTINRPEKISLSLLPITTARAFGRESELKKLSIAWKDNGTNLFQIIAFGGVGKSALVNNWLSQLDAQNYLGAKRVYAWSFYWQGENQDVKSSADYFIEHALDWFGDETPSTGPPWAKATRLANLIRMSKTLLILDGLETVQFAPGSKTGQIDNPAVSLLVRELAADNNGLCVVTSRLQISDLSAFEGVRVQTISLPHLPLTSSINLLKNLEIKGQLVDYIRAVRRYSGHALSLSLLGGYLSVVHGGAVKEHERVKSLFDEKSQCTQAQNLMTNYLKWFENRPECSILYFVGLFDRSVSLSDLRLLVEKHSKSGFMEELRELTVIQWSYAIENLKEANLVSTDNRKSAVFLDCHPLVRDFLGSHLKSEHTALWTQGHRIIFEHLQDQVVHTPVSMTDLEPLFRAVIHGTKAGMYRQSFQLYFNHIKSKQFSIFTEGSHHADQACLMAFFKDECFDPVEELSEEEGFYLLSCVAANLIYLGNTESAIPPALQSIDWFLKQDMWLEAISTAAPLASMLIAMGRLAETIELIDDMKVCVTNTNNSVIEAISWSFQAFAFHLSGKESLARELFEKADEIILKCVPDSEVTFPTVSSYYCKFLLDTGAVKEALERSLKTMAWRESKTWQVAIDTTSLYASDMQVLGEIFLALGDIANARVYLNKQANLLKSADEFLYLPSGLTARAKLYIKTNEFDIAKKELDEALQISRRTGAKFGEWEATLTYAELCYSKGDYKLSDEYLKKITNFPGMELYKYRNKEISNLNRRIKNKLRQEAKKEDAKK